MDDHRPPRALSDAEIERDLERALAVDPSPEFVARVRTRIATEPEPHGWFGMPLWRRASALRWPLVVASLALVLAVVFLNRPRAPIAGAALAARVFPTAAGPLPDVGSGFARSESHVVVAFRRTLASPTEAGHHVRSAVVDPTPLLDPRETRALRSLIAGVRDNRVDLSTLLRPAAPAPMELPRVDDLVIAPVAIEPIAPMDGAQGVRQ